MTLYVAVLVAPRTMNKHYSDYLICIILYYYFFFIIAQVDGLCRFLGVLVSRCCQTATLYSRIYYIVYKYSSVYVVIFVYTSVAYLPNNDNMRYRLQYVFSCEAVLSISC
jgi:hypothetical protein